MPLPPPPAKRGARLSTDVIELAARRPSSASPSPSPREPARKPADPTPAILRAAPAVVARAPAPLPEHVPAAPSAPVRPVAKARAPIRARATGASRLFVLDTNVLLHDPSALFRFEEHDIFLPMVVLEELDAHKKGMTEVARNGRQTSRLLDALAGVKGADMAQGLLLDATGNIDARGKLHFQTGPLDADVLASLPQSKADNQILTVVAALKKREAPREVVLVSKDINMRVKARALGLAAEDYQNDKTLDDGDLLYSGTLQLPPDFWTRQSKTVESWQSGSATYYRISGPIVPSLQINQFVFFESPGEPSLYARVTEIQGKTAVLRTLKDFTHLKNGVWGVTARNREQNFALNLLMDPEIDFVTLAGTAGTG